MQPHFTVHVQKDVDVKDALVIVGTPGLGLVGTIASQYAVGHLTMKPIGGVHSLALPQRATIVNGRPLPPIRMHFAQERTKLPFACDRLVIVTTETAVEDAATPSLAEALAAWAKEKRVRALVVLDGIVVESPEDEDIVVGVPSSDGGAKLLEAQRVTLLPSGYVGGLAGALLHAGQRHGVDVVALLAETAPGFPDAKAAARLVEILDRMVPGIKIETGPLLKEAEDIESTIREQRKRQEAGAPSQREDVLMYG